jgi:hypothetical protein
MGSADSVVVELEEAQTISGRLLASGFEELLEVRWRVGSGELLELSACTRRSDNGEVEEEEAPPLDPGGIVCGDTARRSTCCSGRGVWPPVLLRTETRTVSCAGRRRFSG